MVDAQGSFESNEGGVGEHDDDGLGGEKKPAELAVGGDGEQLVAEIHEDAVVSGRVVGEVTRWSWATTDCQRGQAAPSTHVALLSYRYCRATVLIFEAFSDPLATS
jgi:hypothetical protein